MLKTNIKTYKKNISVGCSLSRRETTHPDAQPNEELYRFGADGNLQAYMYENLLYVHYGYDGGTTRTYKYSFDLTPNWVNGRLEAVNFNPHTAMFYPNSYLNFNQDGHYTKHYYNGMERIASRLGDRNLQIHTHAPELQDRKDQLDSNIRRNIVDITGYEFLEPGEEQNHEDPKPVFELPQVGLNNLTPNTSSVYYYHPNHLGSTCYVTDGNASVQQGFLYAPFGEITNEYNSGWQNGTLPKYSFNAKELDEETGFYYYEARYYAPPVFTSRDRLFEKYPFMSPYGYCMNNPIKYLDPSGDSVKFIGEFKKEAYREFKAGAHAFGIKVWKNLKGHIKGKYVGEGEMSEESRLILDAINSTAVKVIINSTNKESTDKGEAFFGGFFGGSDYFVDKDGNKRAVAHQGVNIFDLINMDICYGKKGQDILHEVTEAYIGGLLAIKNERSVGNSNQDRQIYKEAHATAIPQSGPVIKKDIYYDIVTQKKEGVRWELNNGYYRQWPRRNTNVKY